MLPPPTRPFFRLARAFSSFPGPSNGNLDWQKLAWETQEKLMKTERKNRQAEKRYHQEVKVSHLRQHIVTYIA
jgi:hypothetical protein